MTLNLGKEIFGTKVTCDKLARDECPVENLISNNPLISKRGYAAERFISPPVLITFNFQWPILIHSIVAKCSLESQQTKIIQVSTRSMEEQYIFAGSGKVESECDILEFINNSYSGDEPRRGCAISRTIVSKLTNRHFFGNRGIRSLRLKLIGGQTVLGFIEIWGRPTNRRDIESALSIANSKTDSVRDMPIRHFNSEPPEKVQNDQKTVCDLKETRDRRRLKRKLNELSNEDIPSDFLDDLTNELMILPFILPSGKIIDKMTIEKHNEEEMKWNRRPNDPFTGIPYNDKSKPVYHTSLKARIDEFLIQNENIGSMRTVGGKEQSCSKLVKIDKDRKEESVKNTATNSSAPLLQSSSNSLSDVLADVLSKIPDRTNTTQRNVKVCCQCKNKEDLYKIVSCSHLICRNCISKEKKLCPSCQTEYDNAKIVKVHSI